VTLFFHGGGWTVDDAYAAAGWVAAVGRERGVDPTRLAVAGDSAGGNLATFARSWARACRLRLLARQQLESGRGRHETAC
jgi:acetyl esterase